MNKQPQYIINFSLETLAKFIQLEGISTSELVEKYSHKVLGNELGFDGGLGPDDKVKVLELLKSLDKK